MAPAPPAAIPRATTWRGSGPLDLGSTTLDTAAKELAGHGARFRTAFRDVHALLRPGGGLVIADLVQPTGERGLALASRMWNESVRDQGLVGDGRRRALREEIVTRACKPCLMTPRSVLTRVRYPGELTEA